MKEEKGGLGQAFISRPSTVCDHSKHLVVDIHTCPPRALHSFWPDLKETII